MFNLDEVQRERLTSSLSLRKMTVTAYTLDTVQTVFVELFCTPKSSMVNPSLRVIGHGSSASRTFTADNCPEDEYGLWAIDEATGEQDCNDEERSCFWTWDDNEHAWQSRPFVGRQVKRRKSKAQGKSKGGFKAIGRAFLGEEQAQDREWWSEEDIVWWSKGKKGKKGFSKGNEGFHNGGFRTYQPEKRQAMISTRTKGRSEDQKRKG